VACEMNLINHSLARKQGHKKAQRRTQKAQNEFDPSPG